MTDTVIQCPAVLFSKFVNKNKYSKVASGFGQVDLIDTNTTKPFTILQYYNPNIDVKGNTIYFNCVANREYFFEFIASQTQVTNTISYVINYEDGSNVKGTVNVKNGYFSFIRNISPKAFSITFSCDYINKNLSEYTTNMITGSFNIYLFKDKNTKYVTQCKTLNSF